MAQPFSVLADARDGAPHRSRAMSTRQGPRPPRSPRRRVGCWPTGPAPDSQLVWFNRAGQPQRTIKAPPAPQPEPVAGSEVSARGQRHRCVARRSRSGRGHAHRCRQHTAPVARRTNCLHLRPHRRCLRPLRALHQRKCRGSALLRTRRTSRQRLVEGRTVPRLRQHERGDEDGPVDDADSGRRRPDPLLVTPFNEFQAQISPDGRWIAYASDESGTWEVYVQSFPVLGAKRAISTGGGSEPQWRPDGRELFYLTADGTLMSVEVRRGGAAG